MIIKKHIKGDIKKFQKITKNWTVFDIYEYDPSYDPIHSKRNNWDVYFKIAYSIIDNFKIIRTKNDWINRVDILPIGPIELSKYITTIHL